MIDNYLHEQMDVRAAQKITLSVAEYEQAMLQGCAAEYERGYDAGHWNGVLMGVFGTCLSLLMLYWIVA